jgi:hypothetical protein
LMNNSPMLKTAWPKSSLSKRSFSLPK